MDALSIFKEQIGDRLLPIIIKYDPYLDKFQTTRIFTFKILILKINL